MAPSRSTFSTGFSTGWRVCSFRMTNTVSSDRPSACSCVQPVNSCGYGIQECHPPLRVGGDHRIADAGERHPQPLLLLTHLLLGPPPLNDDGGLVGPDAQQQSVLFGGEVGIAGAGDENAVVVADAEPGDGDVQRPGPERVGDGGGQIAPVGIRSGASAALTASSCAASRRCLLRTTSTGPSPVSPASRT